MMNEDYYMPDDIFESFEGGRFLQDNSTLSGSDDGQVLRDTLKVYGSIFAVAFFLFCILRACYPETFNIRSWVDDLKCELAEKARDWGFLGWMWKVRLATDDELREQCGMDALCYIRMFYFGAKICLVGMFNSLWLFPTYATAESSSETEYITDRVAQLTVSYVPPGSPRLIATVIAAYVVFGYTMYLILQEFKWFSKQRHAYLSERAPRNYAIYVAGIPPELQSSVKLQRFFQKCFSEEQVMQADIALKIPQLEKNVSKRESLVLKLEHLINIEAIKGKTPMRRNLRDPTAPPLNAIEVSIEELTDLNEAIDQEITTIENMHNPRLQNMEQGDANSLISGPGSVMGSSIMEGSIMEGYPAGGSVMGASARATGGGSVMGGSTVLSGIPESVGSDVRHMDTVSLSDDASASKNSGGVVGSLQKSMKGSLVNVSGSMGNVAGSLHKNVAGGVTNFASSGMGLANSAIGLLKGSEDGAPRTAGFVSFKKLSTTQAALEMIHSTVPFQLDVAEAPDPDDIAWESVGKSNKQLQVGFLISMTLTILLCLFWTIPMSFVASLSNVESLSAQLPFLADWIEKAPWLGEVLAVLAPLLLVLVNNLLPTLLELITKLESPLSDSLLNAGVFPKLAAFQIIQTFFVSAISGSIWSEVENIANNPGKVIDLLATSLPGQSTYFIQILLVQTLIGLSVELLRISPLALAFLRRYIGPNLTSEERSRTIFGFLRPLNDPLDFQHPEYASNNVLYIMVLFVYTTMAPLVNWFLLFCFILLNCAYRYEFICNYPPKPDSGGKMWLTFMRVVQLATIIAQLTLYGFLALKRLAIAIPLMVPLLVANLLFIWYLGQRHTRLATFLPSSACMKVDRKNYAAGLEDFSFLKDEYKQPALKEKEEVFPDNLDTAREIQHGNTKYETPPGSEADLEDQRDLQDEMENGGVYFQQDVFDESGASTN